MSRWHTLKVDVNNNALEVYLDDTLAFANTVKENIGSIVKLGLSFRESGLVDYVVLKKQDNTIVFRDDFTR